MMSCYTHERRRTLNLLFPAQLLMFTLLQFVGLVHSGIWQQNELPVRTIHGIEGKMMTLFNISHCLHRCCCCVWERQLFHFVHSSIVSPS